MKVKLLIGILFTFFSFVSCDDFLTEKQYDFIGPDLVGDSEEAKEYWLNGVYYTFNSGDYFQYGAFEQMWELDNDDVSGPPWAMSGIGAGNFPGFWGYNVTWTGPYNIIHRANQALLKIGEMVSLTEESKKDAIGQLYFLRAFAYFQLVRAYGPCPIHVLPVSEGSEPHQPRAAVTQVYEQIISDLKQAETMMYSTKSSGYKSGRPGHGAASLLLAKTYLTMASGAAPAGTEVTVLGGAAFTEENGVRVKVSRPAAITHHKEVVAGYEDIDSQEYFQLARDKAYELMQSNEYELFPTWSDIWKIENRNTKEHVFSLQSISANTLLGNSVAYNFMGIMDLTIMRRVQGGWFGLRDHWYELFEEQDSRVSEGVIHRWTGDPELLEGQYRYYPAKHKDKVEAEDSKYGYKKEDVFFDNDANAIARLTKFLCTSNPQEQYGDYPYPWLRYVEAFLIFAEAENEVNGPTAAAYHELNTVRSRSNASAAPANMSKAEFRSFVLEERRRELALEGNRRWDLIRWGIYLPVMNAIDIDENNVVKRRESKSLLLPIPVAEIDANEAISENNPGW